MKETILINLLIFPVCCKIWVSYFVTLGLICMSEEVVVSSGNELSLWTKIKNFFFVEPCNCNLFLFPLSLYILLRDLQSNIQNLTYTAPTKPIRPSLNLWWHSSFEHEPIIYGLQAVAGFLLDEYLSKSDELRHNFNKTS